jgi:hypothetical protein
MSDEQLPMVPANIPIANYIQNEQMPQMVLNEDDVAAYNQSASTRDITNPRTTEIMNQPTARNYQYMKPKQRRY